MHGYVEIRMMMQCTDRHEKRLPFEAGGMWAHPSLVLSAMTVQNGETWEEGGGRGTKLRQMRVQHDRLRVRNLRGGGGV